MHVIIQSDHGSSKIGVMLLCVVKTMLKKIKRRVFVGENVLIGSIDWVNRKGMIENTMVIWKSRLCSWGYKSLFCSVESKYGLDSLVFILRDQKIVIVGPSRVGKSSLINALRNNQCGSATGEDNWFDTVSSPSFFMSFTHLFAYASDDLHSSLKILGSK
ncbi:hypothetical protein UlMin_037271 [Ulmus minor]